MLIYAVADIHGRPERIQAIQDRIADHRPNVLVVAGDLVRRWQPQRVLEPLNRLGLPVLVVRGNSDGPRVDLLLSHYPNLHSLHMAKRTIAGVDFVGVGGTVPLPLHSRIAFREAALTARVGEMLTTRTILVAHPPPRGIRDRVLGRFHAGSRAVRRLVDRCSPAVVICGHIHEQAGMETIGPTTVVNCAVGRTCQGALVCYDRQSTPEVSMLS